MCIFMININIGHIIITLLLNVKNFRFFKFIEIFFDSFYALVFVLFLL